jgi:hypothetical protein
MIEITSPENKSTGTGTNTQRKLASWHPSGTYNFEVVPCVLKKFAYSRNNPL